MKPQNSHKIITLFAILLLTTNLDAMIYKCTNEDGGIGLQDNPCSDHEQTEIIELELGDEKDSASHQQLYNNLVKNGSFDHGLEKWQPKYGTQAFNPIDSDGDRKQGAVVVQSTPPKNPEKRLIYQVEMSQCIKLDQGRRYRFAASFKAMGRYKSDHTNRVNLSWYQTEDCSRQGQFADYLEPEPNTHGWQRITKENRLRSLNAKAALITITQSRINANSLQARWDDIELTATEMEPIENEAIEADHQYTLPIGQNHIVNGDFNSGLDFWRHSGNTQWVQNEGVGAPGAIRLAIFSNRGGYGADTLTQCVNIGTNKVFQAGAQVKVDPQSTQKGGGIFRLNWHEKHNCKGRSQAGFKEDRVEYIAGWQELSIDHIEVPLGVHSASIYMTRGVQDSGLFAFFIDDVYFTAIK